MSRLLTVCSAVFYSDLSATLKLSQSEGEKWIVNLIRETRMGADAKIDLEKVPHFCNCAASLFFGADYVSIL